MISHRLPMHNPEDSMELKPYNALQALGLRMQPKDSRSNDLLLTRQQLEQIETIIFDISIPKDAEAQKAAYWRKLTAITEGWFQRFQDAGFDSSIIAYLPDEWLDVAATADPAYPKWLGSVYIEWGERCLEDSGRHHCQLCGWRGRDVGGQCICRFHF